MKKINVKFLIFSILSVLLIGLAANVYAAPTTTKTNDPRVNTDYYVQNTVSIFLNDLESGNRNALNYIDQSNYDLYKQTNE